MIAVQRAIAARGLPSAPQLRRWAAAALDGRRAELTLRIVGPAESRRLNKTYRGKDKATNVLSFPYVAPALRSRLPAAVRGDVVVCAAVVAREAAEQGKPLRAHWAHMVVHGCLHLLGYDHVTARQARAMESLEIRLLDELGFANPYDGPSETAASEQ